MIDESLTSLSARQNNGVSGMSLSPSENVLSLPYPNRVGCMQNHVLCFGGVFSNVQ